MNHRTALIAELAARLDLPVETVASWPDSSWHTTTTEGRKTCPPTARTRDAEFRLLSPPHKPPTVSSQ